MPNLLFKADDVHSKEISAIFDQRALALGDSIASQLILEQEQRLCIQYERLFHQDRWKNITLANPAAHGLLFSFV